MDQQNPLSPTTYFINNIEFQPMSVCLAFVDSPWLILLGDSLDLVFIEHDSYVKSRYM